MKPRVSFFAAYITRLVSLAMKASHGVNRAEVTFK